MNIPDTNLLVTGAGGLLGSRVCSALLKNVNNPQRLFMHYHQIHPFELSPQSIVGDLSDREHVREFAEKINPDIIINCAALADVDRCEQEPDISHKINITAVELLMQSFPKAKLVQISTDYVFPDSPIPSRPDTPTDPMNVYGTHKLQAEKTVLEPSDQNLVIRTNTMFDYGNKRNFFRFVYHSLKNGEEVRCLIDQYSNPLSAASAAKLIIHLIEKDACGIFHIGGAEIVSRHGLGLRIARCFSLPEEFIQPIKSAAIPRPAPRPARAGLDCSETEELLQIPLPRLDDDLLRLRNEMEDQD